MEIIMEIQKKELESMLSTLHRMRRQANATGDANLSHACKTMITEVYKEIDEQFKGAIERKESKGEIRENSFEDGELPSDQEGIIGRIRRAEKNGGNE